MTTRNDGSSTSCSASSTTPLQELGSSQDEALKEGCSYNSQVNVNPDMRLDLAWWLENASHHNRRPLQINHWDLTIESDASTIGWGASCQ